MGPTSLLTRVETPVLFVRASGGPAGAAAAFARLEAALGGPRGRRFWGWLQAGEYRACVVRQAGDDPAFLGVEEGALPAGLHARARHDGPFPAIHETFAALLREHPEDSARPSLEEYRRADEVWVYLPTRR